MSNRLIALSLVAVFLSSAWLIKADVQAKQPPAYNVSIAQVLSSR
ncbi:hypothetical protein ACIGCM_22415 [Pseudomonas sp. NPDC078700]